MVYGCPCRGKYPLYREGGGSHVRDVLNHSFLNQIKYLGSKVTARFVLSLGRHSARFGPDFRASSNAPSAASHTPQGSPGGPGEARRTPCQSPRQTLLSTPEAQPANSLRSCSVSS